MNKTKIHALVDAIIDAREATGEDFELTIGKHIGFAHFDGNKGIETIQEYNYRTFDGFYLAVLSYIKNERA